MKDNLRISPFLLAACAFFVTGCPGAGDRLKADETTTVNKIGDNICFYVPNATNYQLSLIAINARGTPPQDLSATDSPDILLKNERLCIPPSFYKFPENGQYIVQYILASFDDQASQRSVVTGIELSGGDVKTIPLKDSEITR